MCSMVHYVVHFHSVVLLYSHTGTYGRCTGLILLLYATVVLYIHIHIHTYHWLLCRVRTARSVAACVIVRTVGRATSSLDNVIVRLE